MRTILKVTSVLQIIGGILSIILGVISIAGGSVAGIVAGNATGSTQSVGALTTGVLMILGIVVILGGVFSLICGLFGLKGAKGDAGKLKVALILGWISLILAAISAVSGLIGASDSQNAITEILSLVVPILFVVSGTCVKKELQA